jgi:hypothetical protein
LRKEEMNTIQQWITFVSAMLALLIFVVIITLKVQPGRKYSEWMTVALILACVSIGAALGAAV